MFRKYYTFRWKASGIILNEKKVSRIIRETFFQKKVILLRQNVSLGEKVCRTRISSRHCEARPAFCCLGPQSHISSLVIGGLSGLIIKLELSGSATRPCVMSGCVRFQSKREHQTTHAQQEGRRRLFMKTSYTRKRLQQEQIVH